MRKPDEMERNIQLRATELSYRVCALALCAWTLYNCWQSLVNGTEYQPLPALILCLAGSVQSFSQLAMKQKMVAGDEEYRAPNQLVRTVIFTVIAVVVILAIGTYVLVKV